MTKEFRLRRYFDGKAYDFDCQKTSKKFAVRRKGYLKYKGYLVRIIKVRPGLYKIWKRKK